MKKLLLLPMLLLLLLALDSGCKKDPTGPDIPQTVDTLIHQAVFVLNEGNFGDTSGARLTEYDYEKSTVQLDAYEAANHGAHAGSLGDDIRVEGDKLYMLMSGSNTIRVLSLPYNTELFSRTFGGGFDSTIHDLCIDASHQRAYVTRLYSGQVSVLSLDSLRLIKNITVGANPQGLLQVGNKLFVANSGYGFDSTVSVIDIPSLTVTNTIHTPPGPSGIALASTGEVAVACAGDSARGGSVMILKADGTGIVRNIHCPDILFGGIAADKSGFVYVNAQPSGSYSGGPIAKVNVTTEVVTENFLLGTWYAIAFNKYSNDLFVSDILNFSGAPAKIKAVALDGTVRRAFDAQIGAGAFAFYWR